MHATIERLTTEEAATAIHAIGAHFTERLADAETHGDWRTRQSLEDEADRWITSHELSPERTGEILRSAHDDERDVLQRYLAGSRP